MGTGLILLTVILFVALLMGNEKTMIPLSVAYSATVTMMVIYRILA